MTVFERAKKTLELLIAERINFDENEATTRLRLIDVVLNEVLNWPSDQINCEEHVDGDYLDYVLGLPERRIVVEAKRSSKIFEVPAGVLSGKVDVSTVRNHSQQNREAIDQVLRYCQSAGIGIALLSNGHQFLGFLGSRSDGKKPIDGKAMLYASLDDVLSNLGEFWDYFSKEGAARGNLTIALTSARSAPPPPLPLSSRIVGYPGYRIGSEMETDLKILGDLFIQDVVREESITDEFLTECYCSSGALSQYAVVSKEILKTRYSILSEHVRTESVTNKRGTNPKLKDDMIASAMTKRPIILLGDVGVGKSIFLKHLFRIDVKDLLEKTIVFYIDFLQHSGLIDDVPERIVRVITETLLDGHDVDINERQFVRSVYNREINRFRNGIYGSLEQDDPAEYRRHELEMLHKHVANEYEHVKRSLGFLQSSQGYTFVIALDNVDQHQSTFQEQIFVAGQSLAETWPTTVFMSLRPDTFHESRRSGALAAYQPRVFTVSPPRSDQVVIKRLEFARKELVEFGRLPGFPEGLTLDSGSLLVYIDVLIDAFENNIQLIELVDNLSSGNTRRALNFVSTFVGSGYVQTSRILDAHRSGRSYIIPIHEFVRAILYGDHKYYDPQTSPVPNMFSLSSNDPREHFLLPILLAVIQSGGERQSGGFTDLSSLYDQLQRLGYTPNQIAFHMDRAVRADLAETVDHGDSGSLARVTAAGGYLHKVLVSNFPYIDAVVVDTPIVDPAMRSEIRDVQDIADRIVRAEYFMNYLGSCWPFDDEPLAFSWTAVRQEWSRSLEEVKRSVIRAAERRLKR
ncbi:hypothetical protein J2W56_006465 [Nocardia kruczakiae]|uniref:Uncharacterized protein n=1 Tax=Nocardia kruczakiae TaxID=261477 RepID=A0ABU1XQQ6_9NOCA|nr:hypothetical protein [Nocardia kruczakiae]MDR7172699.1 hypothetical protein [Nocardia kruczakiae]